MKNLTYLNLRCSKIPLKMQLFWNYNWNNTKSQLPHTIQKVATLFFCFGYIELYHLTAINEMTIASNNILWLFQNPFGCHSFETMHHIWRHPPTASRHTKKKSLNCSENCHRIKPTEIIFARKLSDAWFNTRQSTYALYGVLLFFIFR